MDEFCIDKAIKAVEDFNAILDDAYKRLTPEEFEDFAQTMLVEVERLRKIVKNEHT